LSALQGLAAEHLDRNTSAIRVGITGSNGKTSTKEMLSAILSRVGPTFRSEGNLNSEIGVALAALAIEPAHRYAVPRYPRTLPG
ncbi:MAG: Mur ligase family protein, partial [Spirochaeta sp.]